MNKIDLKKSIKSPVVNTLVVAFIGIILGILLTPALSPLIATIYHSVDTEPPQISNLSPNDNVYIYDVESISATIIDHGGSGINSDMCYVTLSSLTTPNIEGNYSLNGSTFSFIPSNELQPDVYTATFSIYDNAKRVQEKSTRFVVLEKPNLETNIYEQKGLFNENDDIYGMTWKDGYLQFDFVIENTCSNTVYENIGLALNFPGEVIKTIVRYDIGCQNPEFKDSFSDVMFIEDGKTNTNISSSTLLIGIDKMYPKGAFIGTVFIDPYYTRNKNGLVIFSDSTGEYYGEFTCSQFGKTYTEDLSGLINASPEFYYTKGLFIKNESIETKFYERLISALSFFDKAIDLGFNSSDVWIEKGECNLYFGNLPESLLCFNEATKIGQNERAYYDIGLLYFKLGNFEKSRYYCNKSLSINDDFQPALSLLEKSKETNLLILPEILPKESIDLINESTFSVVFDTDTEALLSNPQYELILFDFNKNDKRFILSRSPDSHLVFLVLDLESGIRAVQIDLNELNPGVKKTKVIFGYSDETGPQLTISNEDISEASEITSLNNYVLQNAQDQETVLALSIA